jgi:hypothetical protein
MTSTALLVMDGQQGLVDRFAGDGRATIGPRQRVRLEIPCALPAAGRPITLFAVVRVLAGDGGARRPARGLADATLVISRSRQERSPVPRQVTPEHEVTNSHAVTSAQAG